MRATLLAALMLALWPLEVSAQSFSPNANGAPAPCVNY